MGCHISKEDLKHITQEEVGRLISNDSKKKINTYKYSVDNKAYYDPWEVEEKVENIELAPVHKESYKDVSNVDVVSDDDTIENNFETKNTTKNSESQTESTEGIDFDWDLTDKTDTETQVTNIFFLK